MTGIPRALVVAGALLGCRTDQTIVAPDPHLDRMLTQERRLAYAEDPLLPGRMEMQKPPDGTVPVDMAFVDPLATLGAKDGRWAERIPIPVDRGLVEAGHIGFDTLCAACHGVLGDGVSVVAEKMALRAPPSLQDARIRAYAPGRVFQTIREGYGLMPSYQAQLSVEETWGVVAYLRALQLARRAFVAELPPDLRRQLIEKAR